MQWEELGPKQVAQDESQAVHTPPVMNWVLKHGEIHFMPTLKSLCETHSEQETEFVQAEQPSKQWLKII